MSEAVERLMRLPMPMDYREEWLDYSALGITSRDAESLMELASPAVVTRGKLGATAFAPAAHSWRAMAQMRTPGAVPVVIDLLATLEVLPDRSEALEDSTAWVLNESARVLGEFGPAALPDLISCVENESVSHWVRGRCADAVVIVAQNHPEVRSAVVDVVARTLSGYLHHDPYFTMNIVQCLVDLSAWEKKDLLLRVVACEPRMDADVELWPEFLQEVWRGRGALRDEEVCDEAPYAMLLSRFEPWPESAAVQRLLSLGAPKELEPWFDYSEFGIDSGDIAELMRILDGWTPKFSCVCVGENVGVLHCCRALAQMRAPAALEPLFRLVSRAMAQHRTGEFGMLLLASELMSPYAEHAVDPLLRIVESFQESGPDRLLAFQMLFPAFPGAGLDVYKEALTRVVAVLESAGTSSQLREEMEDWLRELGILKD